jgi:hypothetical protein
MSIENMKFGWKSCLYLAGITYLVIVLSCFVVAALIELINGHRTAVLGYPLVRALLCFAFLVFAWIYFVSNRRHMKMVYGFIQVIGGLAVDWYQLGRVSEEGWHTNNVFERLLFLIAGFVAISSGFKDIFEGLKEAGTEIEF